MSTEQLWRTLWNPKSSFSIDYDGFHIFMIQSFILIEKKSQFVASRVKRKDLQNEAGGSMDQ